MFSLVILIIGAAALGVARGGSLQSLADTEFRWGWLIFVGLAAQLGTDLWAPAWLQGERALIVVLASNALIAAFLIRNRRLPGVVMAGLGLLLNVVVIAANGAMPVSARAVETAGVSKPLGEAGLKHEPMADDTVLPWLGDAVPVPGLREVLSVGDVVLALGLTRLVYVRTRGSARARHGARPS